MLTLLEKELTKSFAKKLKHTAKIRLIIKPTPGEKLPVVHLQDTRGEWHSFTEWKDARAFLFDWSPLPKKTRPKLTKRVSANIPLEMHQQLELGKKASGLYKAEIVRSCLAMALRKPKKSR